MRTNNSVMKIQNFVVNHKSRPIKLNPVTPHSHFLEGELIHWVGTAKKVTISSASAHKKAER